jgi:hypothetical protein
MVMVHPANVMNFFNIMIPIVMFDVLSDVPQVDDFFSEYDVDEKYNDIRG